MKILTELRRFAETTSVKGLPRIMKSNYIPLKILWVVSVITFLGMASYQTAILLAEYFSYPSITNVEVHHVNLVTDKSVHLPDITVCNLNPLSERAYTSSHFTTVHRYHDTDLSDTAEHINRTLRDQVHDRLLASLYDLRRYYGHLDLQDAARAGHSTEEFIVSCRILVLQGLDMDERDCKQLGNITLYQHPRYFNCFTIAMAEQTAEELTVGYSLTLHLGNFIMKRYQYTRGRRKFRMGAMVVLHEPATYPNIPEDGHHVSPGTHVNIRYNLENQNRLPPPHGTCSEDNIFENWLESQDVDFPFKYTRPMCISLKVGWNVLSQCNCTEHTLIHILRYFPSMPPICGTERPSVNQTVEEMLCADRWSGGSTTQRIVVTCPTPCNELHYKSEISQSNWPPDPVSREFYADLIEGRPYAIHYAPVKEAIEAEDKSHLSDSQERAARDLIAQNFVNINAYIGRLAVFNVTDTPKITVTTLVSQLGGTLNFWAGITVVLVIELMEFTIRLFLISSQTKKSSAIVENKNSVDLYQNASEGNNYAVASV